MPFPDASLIICSFSSFVNILFIIVAFSFCSISRSDELGAITFVNTGLAVRFQPELVFEITGILNICLLQKIKIYLAAIMASKNVVFTGVIK